MNDLGGQVWLITGSSSGLGRALAMRVLAAGGRVIATGRNADALRELSQAGEVEAVAADLAESGSAERVVAAGAARFGRIDVLVNCAGYGLLGALEECSEAEVRQLFELNLFAAIAMTRAALPVMRDGGAGGVIVNYSSIAGILGFAGSGLYCASKWAIEGLSESLVLELEPFGIGVLVVEPGPFRTDFAGRSIVEVARPIAAYENAAATRAWSASTDGRQEGDPVRAADAVISAVMDPGRPLRLVIGGGAFDAVVAGLDARVRDVERSRATASLADFTD